MNKDEFTFEGRGRIDRVDTFTSKAGNEVVTLVFQVEGQYPQLIPVKVFGRLAAVAADIKRGDVVEVTGRLGGREWNAKVYGDNVAETIEIVSAEPAKTEAKVDAAPPPGDDDCPF